VVAKYVHDVGYVGLVWWFRVELAGQITMAASFAAPRMPRFLPMKLLQILLPLYDNGGVSYPKAMFDRIRSELTDAFGGVTAFLRSPAVGLWEDESGEVQRDDVVLFEIMTDDLDRGWWQHYRHDLQNRFRQQSIMIRATDVDML
jgi:hypothetical protein